MFRVPQTASGAAFSCEIEGELPVGAVAARAREPRALAIRRLYRGTFEVGQVGVAFFVIVRPSSRPLMNQAGSSHSLFQPPKAMSNGSPRYLPSRRKWR